MKLDDKAIEKIIAMFDEEIAALEKEVKETAATALEAAEAEALNAAKTTETVEAAEAAEVAEAAETAEAAESAEVIEETEDDIIEHNEEADAGEVTEQAEDAEDTDESAEDSVPVENDEPADDVKPVEDDEPADEAEPVEDNEPAAEAAATQSSTLKNVLGIIGYIASVVAITVLAVIGVNLLDNNLQSLKPVTPPDVPQADLAASLQSYTANEVVSQEAVPNYTLEQIYALDLRKPSGATEADLKKVTKAGLVGLEDTFLEAEEKYGVNAIFLMSIASLESAHGTQMFRTNNMFGYGNSGYPSKEACIMDVAQGLSSKYLNPSGSLYGGSSTLKGVNKRYAANPQWYAKVGKYMKSYYDVIAPYHNQSLEKIK